MKKLIWTALVAATTTGAAILAIRVLRVGWMKVLHEEPPPQPWWARKLVGGPLKKGVETAAV